MKKIFIRIIALVAASGLLFLLTLHVENLANKVGELQGEYPLLRAFIAFWGMLTSICIFVLWGLMLYHWGTVSFLSQKIKRNWFLTMVLGMFVGSWFYYIIVFELNKFLKQNEND